MTEDGQTIAGLISAWAGGAVATLVGATIGRLMYHAGEVRKMNRKPFDKNLIWELPVAVGMGIIADGLAAYFALDRTVSTSIAVGVGYLGPGGVQALFLRWFEKKTSS